MSEILVSVLNMPYDMFWNDSPLTRHQHDAIRLEAAKQIEALSSIAKKPIIDYSEKDINQELRMNLRFLGTTQHVYEKGTCVLLTLDQLDYLLKSKTE